MRSEHRLHPLSPFFAVFSGARAFLLPLVLVLFTTRGGLELWFAIFLIPYLMAALVRYASYRYILADDELIIRTGIFFRNERHVPYSRIHNLATVQNPLHRLFGVADVRVETAGGAEPEARIQVLSREAREEMRRRIFSGRESPPEGAPRGESAPEPAGRTLLRLPAGELLLHGIVDNRGMVVVGAILGLLWEANLLDPSRLPGLRGVVEQAGAARTPVLWTILGLAALVAFLLLLRVFSIGWAMVTLHGFEVRSDGKELRTSYGLFTRNVTGIPLQRIQLLSVQEKLLQRLFGRVEVHADTAGGNPSAASARRAKLAPLLRRARLRAFVQELQPEVDLDRIDWHPVHPAAARRRLRRFVLAALLATALAVWIGGRWGVALLPPLLLVSFLDALHGTPRMGWSATDALAAYRSGWLWRELTIVRTSKVQTVSVTRSPFDRRWGMATLSLDTAGGGPVGPRLRMRYLDAETAAFLLHQLGRRAASTAFRW